MEKIKGKYNEAVCFAKTIEETAADQIKTVCDLEAFSGSKIRIMPDVHAGKGCTIGTTMTIKDKIVPGMVGVDIGCGMETTRLADSSIDLEKLDGVIRRSIPSGRNIRDIPHSFAAQTDLSRLRCAEHVDINRARKSIGTLGGGNHFIEIDADDSGLLYLIVHSGSRHIGNEVAKYYQDKASEILRCPSKEQVTDLISSLKTAGRDKEIEASLRALYADFKPDAGIPSDLTYLTGEAFTDYIHDMKIIRMFAVINRLAMTNVILQEMELETLGSFTTVHNYIDTESMILRKGAVSAKKNEKLLIPINMRDGSLICTGKGNEDWNCSAPHGAGRLMSRKSAMKNLSMNEYVFEMKRVYSTCVSEKTLDESPMAYKSIDEIMALIEPTADVVARIKPIFNFKASE